MSRAGIVVIDKPSGMTSHDVVAILRREFKTRRVGHGGTLDPMATGVLVLGVEAGTRALQFIADAAKSYEATARLGQSTNTDDADGEVIATSDTTLVAPADIRDALAAQVGLVGQRPPAFSAIKVAGVRAYARARTGAEVALAARPVRINAISVRDIRRVDGFIDVDFTIDCGKGTYVRAVARDLGDALGVGGHLTALRRTDNAGFTLADAAPLDDPRAGWLDLAPALARFLPVFQVDSAAAADIRHGRPLAWPLPAPADAIALLDASGTTVLAIGKYLPDSGQLGYHAVLETDMAG